MGSTFKHWLEERYISLSQEIQKLALEYSIQPLIPLGYSTQDKPFSET